MANAATKSSIESSAKVASPQGMNCLVAHDTRIEGNFATTEHTRIDGQLKGDVKCDKKLVTGETSILEGKVWAAEAVFMGKITGEIVVSGSVQLTATAVIKGKLSAGSLSVEEGAQLQGEFKIAG
jgi:cytoskeletal protein CcmA (bactofilin family)